ncbi:class I SAM-dependent methyltransferase [Flavicella sediminum]|uniref:class I SAM-dependent methyltransferase n=1 Tax=Flavicella sediminum TaxID=2585141 RepID=UPI0011214DB6|nr:class I SAM-dependent methyltransferase [Flavicella sediminum]
MNKKSEVKKAKTPWPTKAAMEQVYELKLWGSGNTQFYSGGGSHELEIVAPYKAAVIAFLKSFKSPLVVCDLGCGDFNVGKELVPYTQKYKAVDIVANLIEYNKENFEVENLEFHCLDIAVANLPEGDCAIVRQVLQHLSNAEVQNVVKKLANFQYVILTEHLPKGEFIPNKGIISGQGIRLKKQSGLDLQAAPFYFKVKEKRELVSVELENNKGRITTNLYTVF